MARSEYFYDSEHNTISKGLGSVKYMNGKTCDMLYKLAHGKEHKTFVSVLQDLKNTPIDTRQIEILIKIDFFSEFGNQRELLRIEDAYYNLFNRGEASKISKAKVGGSAAEAIIKQYSSDTTKAGTPAKSYTILDMDGLLEAYEKAIKEAGMEDLSDILKVQNFKEYMGYAGYISGKEEDRPKLLVQAVYPLHRKKDKVQFGYSILTKSIGSGKEARFTVFNRVYNPDPIKENDIIYCTGFDREGPYFTLTSYRHIY